MTLAGKGIITSIAGKGPSTVGEGVKSVDHQTLAQQNEPWYCLDAHLSNWWVKPPLKGSSVLPLRPETASPRKGWNVAWKRVHINMKAMTRKGKLVKLKNVPAIRNTETGTVGVYPRTVLRAMKRQGFEA